VKDRVPTQIEISVVEKHEGDPDISWKTEQRTTSIHENSLSE
jgi:hypothetical protein